MTTVDQLVGIAAQNNEITKRVANGSLDPVAVRRALQDIIERKTTPSWYSSVGAQIKEVSKFLELHGGERGFLPSNIPAVPNFAPRTETEVLLLTVTLPDKDDTRSAHRTFDAWWDFITPPRGVNKWCMEELKSDRRRMCLRWRDPMPGIRWMAFDPNSHANESPTQVIDKYRGRYGITDGVAVAGAEVLMAAALFPRWVAGLDGDRLPYPNMSSYQLYSEGRWSLVPLLHRNNHFSQLDLTAQRDRSTGRGFSSPTVREC